MLYELKVNVNHFEILVELNFDIIVELDVPVSAILTDFHDGGVLRIFLAHIIGDLLRNQGRRNKCVNGV